MGFRKGPRGLAVRLTAPAAAGAVVEVEAQDSVQMEEVGEQVQMVLRVHRQPVETAAAGQQTVVQVVGVAVAREVARLRRGPVAMAVTAGQESLSFNGSTRS